MNYGLRTKFQEIPKAQADILSAGLRANPLVFASADGVPYGSYSPQRPGDNSYSVVLIQPIDVNQKRKVRVMVAQQAKKVLDAQYQDAVRLEIDNLYTAFVDVLDARETVRYARASLDGLNQVLKTVERQYARQLVPQTEVENAAIQRDTGEVSLEQAETALRQAKRALAVLLDIPPGEADGLEIRGSIRDETAPPPPPDDLATPRPLRPARCRFLPAGRPPCPGGREITEGRAVPGCVRPLHALRLSQQRPGG